MEGAYIMNRTAQCIKMLRLLKTRKQMTSKELAEELQTNPRNIREYRKELEAAGYTIVEKRGRYGGYSLDDKKLLPISKLSADELRALITVRDYMQGKEPLVSPASPLDVLNKVIAANSGEAPGEVIRYIKGADLSIPSAIRTMIDDAEKAIKNHQKVILRYCKTGSTSFENRKVHPYGLVGCENNYYLAGWDELRKDWRWFRFSDQRMESLTVCPNETFLMDSNFHIENYIGSSSIFKGKVTFYKVLVHPDAERHFMEIYWGDNLEHLGSRDGYEEYSFTFDNERRLMDNLFHFGGQVILTEPAEAKERMTERLQTMLQAYTAQEGADQK